MSVAKPFPALQVGNYFDDVETGSESPAASMSSAVNGQLFEDLAAVTNAVGTSDFYETAAATVARMLKSERYLVIRYSQYTKPEFMVNTAMTEVALSDYLDNFYRIDPLFRMVRNGVKDPVLTFEQLKRNGTDTLFYDELFRTAAILDELVLLLPTVGGILTAISVDRAHGVFSKEEVAAARKVFPLLEQLHALHVDRCVFGWNGSYLNDSHIAFMMMDTSGNTAFRNTLWSKRVSKDLEFQIKVFSAESPQGLKAIDETRIIHWEKLDAKNAIAPNGKACLLEELAPGYVDVSADDLVEKFATEQGLTPRETEIVKFILEGHPASLIADKLGVSVGTIRNHKHRLYYKLDITTERELFCMFFNLIKS